jgi:CubicO group peptidase (beta-lactamase class C family)
MGDLTMDIKNIEQIILDEGFRGCAMISKDSTTIYARAFGYADFPNKIPNTLETKFATASAGKVFVAVAILQLIESGKLHFHDTIGNIVPIDWKKIDREITIEQLLTHTSGIPDYCDETVITDYEDLWKDFPNYKIRKNSDLLPLFIDEPMIYPRGEKFQYNNTGFVVLAMVIEAVTGEPFDHYLNDHIFQPCKMISTGYYELDCLPANCANNYLFDKEKKRFRTNIYSVDAKGTGAGGVFTTLGDIKNFWTSLLSYQLLSPNNTRQMLDCHAGSIESDYYGYGIWLKPDEKNGYFPFFQGCDPGVSFLSTYVPEKDMMITLISNYEDNVWRLQKNLFPYIAKA